MITCFEQGKRYSHSNPFCSLDILVLDILDDNELDFRLLIQYIHKSSGNIQFTGKGEDKHTDEVTIKKSDLKYWCIV